MKNIKQYRIVSSQYASDLESNIDVLLKENYAPLGSLAYVYDPEERCMVYAQALVRLNETGASEN